jgi:putative flippase GtrA
MGGVVAAADRRLEAVIRALGVGRVARPSRAVRAVEFGAVGATGAAVNTAVFLVAPIAYFVAGALAFAAAAAWTFSLNWTVTYDRPSHSLPRAFGRYASVYTLGFLVYSAALLAGVELLSLPGFSANIAAIAVAGTVNFTGSELFALGDRS